MLLVDAGNTFIKWAMTHPDQSFSAESISWKEFGAVRHHELSSLKDTWQALHRESPFERVIISNVAGQNLGNTLFDFLKTLEPRPQKIDWFYSAPSLAGIKNTYLDFLIVQPTHLMHGAEYDEMNEMLDQYRDKFESVAVAEPLLGEVGADASVINADKEAVAKAVTAAAVKEAGYDSTAAAAADKTAFVFMGHGTSHTAKVSYSQMQTTMQTLGYDNVFIGTVEGEPEDTSCEAVIEAVKAAGYTKVILRPLMVVAGDHANNDMAGEDADSWLSQFTAAGCFENVDCQISGLGRIADVQQLYIAHTKAAMDLLNG